MDLAIEEGQEKRHWRWSPCATAITGIAATTRRWPATRGPHRHVACTNSEAIATNAPPSAARPCSAQSIKHVAAPARPLSLLVSMCRPSSRAWQTRNRRSRIGGPLPVWALATRRRMPPPTPRRSANIVGKNGGGIMPLGGASERQAVTGLRLGAWSAALRRSSRWATPDECCTFDDNRDS